MFYDPKDGHGLAHNPFNAIVTPRPIGWISTRGKQGQDNLAPYSFFNAVAYTPPQVMFASTSQKDDRHIGKDSIANIDETGVFCVNIVSHALIEPMNNSSGSYGADVDEFAIADLAKEDCKAIPCARVAAAPAALECKLTQIIKLEGASNYAVFGQVVGVHIQDEHIVAGRLDVTSYRPVARLGYRDYSTVDSVFSLARPAD